MSCAAQLNRFSRVDVVTGQCILRNMIVPVDILLGAAAIGAVHAVIPNHWLPLVAISRSEGWSRRETLLTTLLVACCHVSGTILVGAAVSAFGMSFVEGSHEQAHLFSRYILIVVGLLFVLSGLKHARQCHHHRLRLVGGGPEEHQLLKKMGVVFTLSVAMFLSPCMDIIGYFFSVSLLGWEAVIWLAVIFALTTIPLLVALVGLGLSGIDRLNWKVLDHHGRTITGVLLVLLGIAGAWIE